MAKSGTLILSVAATLLMPLQLVFSLFLLLRGHDEPGGGFIAGLVAAGAFTLYQFARGAAATKRLLRVDTRDLMGVGLLLGVLSGMPAWLMGQPFLTAQWWSVPVLEITLSTPLIFDIGVYLVVMGAVLTAVIALTEEEDRAPIGRADKRVADERRKEASWKR